MLLSDFITVALIPTLVHKNASEVSRNEKTQIEHTHPFFQSSEEGEIFGQDEFFNSDTPSSFPFLSKDIEKNRAKSRLLTADPILREIYEEEKRLNLAEDDFDVRSEEARDLISFQRRKLNMMQNLVTQAGTSTVSSVKTLQGRSMFFGSNNDRPNEDDHVAVTHSTTEVPILMSTPSEENEPSIILEESTTTVATPQKRTNRLGISGTFGKVKQGIGSAYSSVRNKILGGSNTQTTTTTTTPSSNRIPNDDKSDQGPPPQANDNPNSIVSKEGEAKPTASVPVKCTETQTKYDGLCYNVLQQYPCPVGQWLIEDDDTGKGKCVENKCANVPYHAYFDGKCVAVRSEGDHCHKGMITYIFKNGEVECDCKPQYLFNHRDGNCYPAYRRGPCNMGEIFATKITERGTIPASCVKSPCSEDGYFCNAPKCPKDVNVTAYITAVFSISITITQLLFRLTSFQRMWLQV